MKKQPANVMYACFHAIVQASAHQRRKQHATQEQARREGLVNQRVTGISIHSIRPIGYLHI